MNPATAMLSRKGARANTCTSLSSDSESEVGQWSRSTSKTATADPARADLKRRRTR